MSDLGLIEVKDVRGEMIAGAGNISEVNLYQATCRLESNKSLSFKCDLARRYDL